MREWAGIKYWLHAVNLPPDPEYEPARFTFLFFTTWMDAIISYLYEPPN